MVLNFQVGRLSFVYFGMPIGGDAIHLSFWQPLILRINSRRSG